jgi:hypothetical protein
VERNRSAATCVWYKHVLDTETQKTCDLAPSCNRVQFDFGGLPWLAAHNFQARAASRLAHEIAIDRI